MQAAQDPRLQSLRDAGYFDAEGWLAEIDKLCEAYDESPIDNELLQICIRMNRGGMQSLLGAIEAELRLRALFRMRHAKPAH